MKEVSPFICDVYVRTGTQITLWTLGQTPNIQYGPGKPITTGTGQTLWIRKPIN